MTRSLFVFAAACSIILLNGCFFDGSRAKAAHRVNPVIEGLEAYFHDHQDYPKNLEDLKPRYLREDIPLTTRTAGSGLLLYKREDSSHYSLMFDDGRNDRWYTNGMLEFVKRKPY